MNIKFFEEFLQALLIVSGIFFAICLFLSFAFPTSGTVVAGNNFSTAVYETAGEQQKKILIIKEISPLYSVNVNLSDLNGWAKFQVEFLKKVSSGSQKLAAVKEVEVSRYSGVDEDGRTYVDGSLSGRSLMKLTEPGEYILNVRALWEDDSFGRMSAPTGHISINKDVVSGDFTWLWFKICGVIMFLGAMLFIGYVFFPRSRTVYG
jgi:hypothetical protein